MVARQPVVSWITWQVPAMPFDRTMSHDPKREFAERLARIEAGGLHTNRTVFVGVEEAMAVPPGTFARRPKPRSRLGLLFLGLVVLASVVIGATMASANFY
jgi:hypothetical protein